MNGVYDPSLVVLSIAIAVFASYVALDLAKSVTAARGGARLGWIAGGALAMGTGIWSMHFVGMLAFHVPGMPIAYDMWLVLLSIGIAIGASGLALFVVSRPHLRVTTLAGAALAMGGAIAGMHYTGMWSLRTAGVIQWDRSLVAASLVIAVGASFAALWMAVRFRMDASRRGSRLRLAGSGLMGLAIAGMHYTAMAAARFVPASGVEIHDDLLATQGLAIAVIGTTVLILAIAVAGSVTSRELARRATLTRELERLYTEMSESAESYRLLFEASPHPMWVYAPETLAFLAVNDTAVQQFGYTREELLGKSLWDLHLPEDHPLLSAHSAQRQQGLATRSTWRIIRGDGSLVDVEVDARSIVYSGTPARLALVQDVTQRKQDEEKLRRQAAILADSERRLSTLVRNLPGVVYRCRNDPQWTMEYIGGRTQELLGYTPEEMTDGGAASLAELIHPEDRAQVWNTVQTAARNRESYEVEYRIRSRGGEEKWIWEQGVGIHSDAGELLGLEGFITDVSPIKRVEEQHRRLLLEQAARREADAAQQRVREILESIRDAFFAADHGGRFTYVNAAAERVLGHRREELLGKILWEQFPGTLGSVFEEKYREVLDTGQAVGFETQYAPFGAWLDVRAYPAAEGVAVYLRDVTQRREAQEALRRSEERFRALTEYSSDLITVLDTKGHIRYESASLHRVLGYTADELLGRSAFGLVHPEDLPQVVETFQRILEDPTPQTVQFRFLHKSGEWRRFESIGSNRVDDPAVEGVLVNSRDVTARIQSEERLRESEERFRQMAESIREVFWMRDATLAEILYLSPAYADVWGRSPEEREPGLEGWLDTVHGHDRAYAAAAYTPERVANGGIDVEYRIVRPDGETRWIHDRAFPIRRPDGEIYRVAGIAEDISERKYIEQALQRSQDALEALLRASPDIVEILSLEGRFEWTSPALRAVMGYESADVRGRPMIELVHPEDQENTTASLRTLAEGTAEEIRERYRACHAHGHWIVLEATGRAMVRDEERKLVLVARDVTEQVQLEEALHAAKEDAERASRAKSDFLSRMSHELRTPLNAILGFGQLLETDVRREEDRESVEHILGAGRHLLVLIDEVLDLSRIEAGQMNTEIESVDVPEVVQQSLDLVRHIALQRGISIDAGHAYAHTLAVAADRQRLKQVLLNLMSNAIKYNRSGGSVKVLFEPANGARARIVVEDTGPGIPAEKLDRLFVPFERLNAERSGVEGTGLGLALSRGLMEAMGGTLGVESREGVGSRFWAELPLAAPVAPRAAHSAMDETTPSADTHTTRTVLLVEDHLANVRLMERIFRRRPEVRLIVAMQGSMGIELAREHRPILILLDLNLPDISGRDVLQRLRGIPELYDTPVVMVSGDAMPEQVDRLKAEGAQGYITKPFNVNEVLELVDATLRANPGHPDQGGA